MRSFGNASALAPKAMHEERTHLLSPSTRAVEQVTYARIRTYAHSNKCAAIVAHTVHSLSVRVCAMLFARIVRFDFVALITSLQTRSAMPAEVLSYSSMHASEYTII